ncbi:MAG: transporter substrate-binding domain-containing protein [Muribaculaceae bacterium]|nr:transporter substrate-binding domain-containing protein [Muribaculaceae bacterium]
MRTRPKYLQIAAYVMIVIIMVFIMGAFRDCGRINIVNKEGYSGGDTLDVALIYGPSSYYFYTDSLSGINHEIAIAFSEETSTPIKIWPISQPAEGLQKLDKGAFDIVASLPLDNNIKNSFPVSESIFLDRLVLIQLADSISGEPEITSSLQLDGKTVNVAEGSSAVQRLKNLSEEIGGNITIIEEPEASDEILALKVATGTIPLAVVNERVASSIAEKYPLLKYDSTVSFTQFQVWVFNPADSIAVEKFNLWFDSFRKKKEYREIVDKF